MKKNYVNKLIYLILLNVAIFNSAFAYSEKALLHMNFSSCEVYRNLTPSNKIQANEIYNDFKVINAPLNDQLLAKEKLLQAEINNPTPNQNNAEKLVKEVAFLHEQILMNSVQMQIDMQKIKFPVIKCLPSHTLTKKPAETAKFKHAVSSLQSSPSQGFQSSGIQGLEINPSQNLDHNNAKN